MAAMANPAQGQLGFEVAGEFYVFAFTANALCAIEETFDLECVSDLKDVIGDRPSIRKLRTLFRIGLHDTRPDMDDEEAGRLITVVGGVVPATELMFLAMQQAFPDQEVAEGGTGSPRKVKRGTGRRST